MGMNTPISRISAFEPLEQRQMLDATRIMPLGDSITQSSSPHSSYRYYLWNSLQNSGRTDIDFVGGERGVRDGQPGNQDFDQDHEGHAGWTTADVLANVRGWATTSQPDIVAIHLGTNDMRYGESVANALSNLAQIIDVLRDVNPNVDILLAKIIPNDENPSGTAALDDAIPSLASDKDRTDSRVILVDQTAGFSLSSDTYDGLHPNDSGEQKMASKFFNAIAPLIDQTVPEPEPEPAPPRRNYTFLSKLDWLSATNGIGPVQKDKSPDGGTMSVGGQTFADGLGVKADSRIEYRLNGRQNYFAADIGIDDETAGNGSVVFKIYADRKLIFSSQVMRGTDPFQYVKLKIKGVKRLTLMVTDAGDGTTLDHANWGKARVIV